MQISSYQRWKGIHYSQFHLGWQSLSSVLAGSVLMPLAVSVIFERLSAVFEAASKRLLITMRHFVT